ncbi:MAG: peptidase M23 [Ideonella sp. MAG2]|nr:MAG: peptidase M23 [Ideonella sp. MAG2]
MQILITSGSTARTRVLNFNQAQLALAITGLVVGLMLVSGLVYHFVFLTAAREGWPVVSQLVKLVVRDEFAQRDRFMRENLDAMASRVGDLQGRMVKLEAMGERVTGLAGVKVDDLKALQRDAKPGGAGGPFVPMDQPTLEQLNNTITTMEQSLDQQGDLFTLAESRLFEKRLSSLMVPNSKPIDVPVGSGFGFRSDPFTGRAALHTGLDFAAPHGTPIMAAAGGVVLSTDYHPQYGNLLELDHGNGLVTRYAHTSRILVKTGDLIKRGQLVAHVGSTGRSTGSHLHFEVLVEGVPQDPARFLAGGPPPTMAAGTPR